MWHGCGDRTVVQAPSIVKLVRPVPTPRVSDAENSGAFFKNACNPGSLRRSEYVVWAGLAAENSFCGTA